MGPRVFWHAYPLLLLILQTGCASPRSALNPAGEASQQIANLFWWMAGTGLLVWIGMVGLAFFAVRARKDVDRDGQAKWMILFGAALPAGVLAILLAYGLTLLPPLIASAPEGTLRISVIGKQWWWRIRYQLPDGRSVELANEVRLPVGEPVEFLLESDNVIHSFWIPSLGGKMDLIPGRVNRLLLRPLKTGSFRGMCAEFCGRAHAKMYFEAIVVPRAEFDAWLALQFRNEVEP